MKSILGAIALALMLLATACTARQEPVPTPAPAGPPTIVGATKYAQGPGLVVEGYTPIKQIHVELRSGTKVLQRADATPKDDGWYRITWPSPEGQAEVVVSDGGKVLVRGALPGAMNTGLFYGPDAQAVRVDVVDPQAMTTLIIEGRVRAPEGKIVIELHDGDKVLGSHPVTLDRGTPDFATINGKWPMAPGARTVHILTGDSKQLLVAVPIVVD
ncbi:MAG TPA: hypothetical protein VD969_16255 [Symbiobacteriaceae bacterium]|nr:hypothetical protein [Symbiobacteriaceae bacterium]